MLTGFISIKVVAVIIGPTGIALLGQLNNFSSIIMTAASGGINNGITKYVAEHKESPSKIRLFLSTALQITIILSFIVGLVFNILFKLFKPDNIIRFVLFLCFYSLWNYYNNLYIKRIFNVRSKWI